MKPYADSSFIVALYLPRESSGKALDFLAGHGLPLPFTPWHRLEVRNAIRLTVFNKAIRSSEARTQLQQLDTDLRDETLVAHHPLVWTDVLHEAEKLGTTHNERVGCRSSDLFHVASASTGGFDHFLTFDARQRIIAQLAGLRVGP